jgi:DNA polymerase delta subunit 1
LKITLALPNMVSVARGVLEKGMIIPGLSNTPLVLPTFESNVLFILRFMVDCKV